MNEDVNLNVGRFVETLLCKYKLFFSTKIGDPLKRNTQILKQPIIHLRIFGVKMVREKQFLYTDPTIIQ